MKTTHTKQRGARNNLLWITSLIGVAALVAACGGGGGGTASVGSGGTGAVFSGPISGFGSVIVNGVRIDDNGSSVTLDDDSAGASGDLKLGMVVEIEGTRNDDGISGKAKTIGSHSVVRGPVTATPIGSTFKVLGLTVTVNAGTVFEGRAGLAALAPNDMVEIHGIPNGPDGVTATRIETTGNNEERLTGVIQFLDPTAKTFTLHGTVINYAAADKLPTVTEFKDGLTVRVKGQLTTPFATEPGTINARQVHVRNLDHLKKAGQLLELEGVVTLFTSVNNFVVNGTPVSVASNARVEGTPALNSRIEVEGTIDANGVLIATKVEVKNESEQKPESNELHGTISNVTTTSFTLRGVTVTFNPQTVTFEGLNASGLRNGITVEVKGTVTATGTALLATRIKLEN